MEEFVDQTKTLVGALGWDLFREMRGRPTEAAQAFRDFPVAPSVDRPRFQFRGEGFAAEMELGPSGEFMVKSGSKARLRTTTTTRTQTELPFGGAAMNRVSTPPVVMAKLAPMSVSVGAPVPSFATSCQRVWVPRWNPMPMQLMAVPSVSVLASAAVDP